MIGNDIIDLALAATESNWQRKGYLEKVYTPAERYLILHAACPADMAWLLWSCKEAVYKIIHRQTRVRTYAPWQFACMEPRLAGSTASGLVVYKGRHYPFRSLITPGYIHTVAGNYHDADIFICRYNGDNYMKMLEAEGILANGQRLVKDAHGIPFLRDDDHYRESPVSISHHGRYFSLVKISE